MSFKSTAYYTVPISCLGKHPEVIKTITKDYMGIKDFNNIEDLMRIKGFYENDTYISENTNVFREDDYIIEVREKTIKFIIPDVTNGQIEDLQNLFVKYEIPFDHYTNETEETGSLRLSWRPNDKYIKHLYCDEVSGEGFLLISSIKNIMDASDNGEEFLNKIREEINRYEATTDIENY